MTPHAESSWTMARATWHILGPHVASTWSTDIHVVLRGVQKYPVRQPYLTMPDHFLAIFWPYRPVFLWVSYVAVVFFYILQLYLRISSTCMVWARNNFPCRRLLESIEATSTRSTEITHPEYGPFMSILFNVLGMSKKNAKRLSRASKLRGITTSGKVHSVKPPGCLRWSESKNTKHHRTSWNIVRIPSKMTIMSLCQWFRSFPCLLDLIPSLLVTKRQSGIQIHRCFAHVCGCYKSLRGSPASSFCTSPIVQPCNTMPHFERHTGMQTLPV